MLDPTLILESLLRDLKYLERSFEEKEALIQEQHIRIDALIKDVRMWRARAERAEQITDSYTDPATPLRAPGAIQSDSPESQVPEK